MSETVSGLNAGGSGVDWESFDSEGFLRRLVNEFGLSLAEIEYAARRLARNEMARLLAGVCIAMEEGYEQARLAGLIDEDE